MLSPGSRIATGQASTPHLTDFCFPNWDFSPPVVNWAATVVQGIVAAYHYSVVFGFWLRSERDWSHQVGMPERQPAPLLVCHHHHYHYHHQSLLWLRSFQPLLRDLRRRSHHLKRVYLENYPNPHSSNSKLSGPRLLCLLLQPSSTQAQAIHYRAPAAQHDLPAAK